MTTETKLLVLNVYHYDGEGGRNDYSWVVPFPSDQKQLKAVMRSWMKELRAYFVSIDFNPLWEVKVEEELFYLAAEGKEIDRFAYTKALNAHMKLEKNPFKPSLALSSKWVDLNPSNVTRVL